VKIAVLGSGSEGNAILVNHGNITILVDAGFSGKTLQERVNAAGFCITDIHALILTHEHSDHIRGAGVLARRFKIPVYGTEGTFRNGRTKLGRLNDVRVLEGGQPIALDNLYVRPFDISHDAEEPVGFIIEDGQSKLGICTDSGCVTQLMRHRLKGCDALVLESNHDSTMLLAGSYPWILKQRIRSRTGHLSNDDAGKFCEEMWHPGLRHVFLAHLSKENNLPDLARMSVEDAIRRAGCVNGETRIHVAMQSLVSDIITL
jgi:phosphoribosyl 1,2-cyclic phosphodiesterase